MAKQHQQKKRKEWPRPAGAAGRFDSRALLAALLFITVLVYANSLKNGFVFNWDDDKYVLTNTDIHEINTRNIKAIFSTCYMANYQPLTMLAYMVQYRLFGPSPRGFHAVSLALHLLNICLVFFFILRLSGRAEAAAIVAAFFAVHPMHVESVAWIAELKDVLYACFYLGALIAYLRYLDSSRPSSLAWALVLFICSLLSKPMAVTLPLLLPVIDYYRGRQLTLRSLAEKLPFFALSLAFGIITVIAQKAPAEIAPVFSPLHRFFLVCYGLCFYLVKLVVPVQLSAVHDYPKTADGMLPLHYYLAPALLGLVAWLLLKSRQLRRDAVFGLLFFICSILIVLQIFPFGRAIVAERYTYVPYIGLLYIVGACYVRFTSARPYFTAGLVFFFIAFCLAAGSRNTYWENAVRLFSDAIAQYPDQERPYWLRGNAYRNQEQLQEAFNDYQTALRLDPNYAEAYMNRGYCYVMMNDRAKAYDDFNKTIQLNPGRHPMAYFNRGNIEFDNRDYDKALASYLTSFALNPTLISALKIAGNIMFLKASYAEALKYYTDYLAKDPQNGEVIFLRANAYHELSDTRHACADWEAANSLGYEPAREALIDYCGPPR